MIELERALGALASEIELPEAPGLATRVRTRIERGPARAPAGFGWRPRVPALVALAALALIVTTLTFAPGVRHAVADFLGIGAVRIEVDEERRPSAPIASSLDLGEPTSAARADALSGGALAIPASLGPPDEVYFDELYPQSVSFVYEASAALPRAEETGVGLLVTAFLESSYEMGALEKGAFVGNAVEPVSVGENRGYWVEGSHEVALLDEEGRTVGESSRLSGNALIWSDGRNTYRIESALGKAAALRLAPTLVP